MNIVLLGKLLVGGAAAAGASVFTLWQTGVIGGEKNQSTDDQAAKELEIYVMKAEQNGSTDMKLTAGAFQCRLKKGVEKPENNPFDCLITQIDLTDSGDKKHFSYEEFSKPDTASIEIKTSDLATDGKVRKIIFQVQYADKATFATTAIEIVSKDTSKTTHATISEWFVVDKNTGTDSDTFLGKTKHFIGKSGESISDSSADGKYKCSWTNDLSSINDTNCTIHNFSTDSENGTSTELSTLNFSGSLSASSTIEASKFYVVVFDKAEDIKMSKEQSQIFVEKKDAPVSKSTFTNIHTSAFAKDKFLVLGENK